jgi:aryl-alcohol dehydrogenase-like predicted oxidoreductase
MQRHFFADGYQISRLIKGSWHLAGGHGAIDQATAIEDMARFVEAGITTFDCADIYTGVEALIGDFRRAYPALATAVQVHTKFVPDLERLASVDVNYVESIIDRSLQRLGMEALDLVQFHWWDYSVPGYVEAALALEALRAKGKIRRIGVTNFDTPRLAELLSAGVSVSTHQVQYSLLDRRPRGPMTDLCRTHGVGLLCYGTVLGGFLSERWLGRDEPGEPYANRSLTKYKLIIDDAGGWDTFQRLLKILEPIAQRHGTDIASIGTAVVLDRPQVAAAIVGATNAAHLDAHRRLDAIRLAPDEHAAIETCLAAHPGPEGDVYTLERDRTGRHGRIMKYNLNT